MFGSHLLLLAHAATGAAGDQIERLIKQHHDATNHHLERDIHPADGRRSVRTRLRVKS